MPNPANNPKGSWRRFLTVFGFYLFLTLAALFLLAQFALPATNREREEVDLSQVVSLVEQGQIQKITVTDSQLTLETKDNRTLTSHKEPQLSLVELLAAAGVENPTQKVTIEIQDTALSAFWGNLLGNLIWAIPLILILFMGWRQAQRTTGGILGFGSAVPRLFNPNAPKITFADVAGVDEAKQELSEVVDFLKNPDKYRKLGARIPKGVLLVGPAGTGKTLLARSTAGEAKVPFYSMAGSEFMEMLVGVGASRIRSLFGQAKKTAPSIIFIDEIESIGRQRATGILSGAHGEQEQTLNQILVEMDGFEPYQGVLVMAATNRPDLLDPALTRPGRFDRRVVLELPDIKGREGIISIHQKGKPLAKAVDIKKLAKRTVGFSGADLENMLNEAAILAARAGAKEISEAHLEEAATKVKMGPQRRRLQSEEDKKMTAYHEAGHAVVAYYLPQVDPVHRVSIVARGLALGFTQIAPQIDRYNQTKSRLLELITMMLGGRAAEELKFNELTVGAGSDLDSANRVARKMVTEFGMSGLGPLSFSHYELDENLMARRFLGQQEVSDKLMAQVDEEVRKILDACLKQAEKILKENETKLDKIAGELVQKETLEAVEFGALMKEG